ncbi:MAG TPA: proline iminopeptidase-family hydrolase [Candidatus Limnocylindrales bacterium]
MIAKEGFVDVTGGRVWFRRFGDSSQMPVLILHGGPGSASDYMQPLAERLGKHRPAIVYDQLGCGRADHPDDDSLWTVDRSVEELDQVREALDLDECYLLGHSWGGWLSIDYMAREPQGIEKLVLASTSASIPQFMAEARKLIDAMPEPARSTIIELGAREEFDNPDYLAAVDVFYHRHLNRMDPWPTPIRTEKTADTRPYQVMNGPTEFDVIGRLATWDRTADLHKITVPTLITVGRYDEITPACAETIHQGVRNSRVVLFENSAHLAHLEEGERYAQVVEEFLSAPA